MQEYWYLLAFLTSIFLASIFIYNQIFKLDGAVVTIYRGLGVFFLLLPFCFFFTPVENQTFYFLSFLQGLVIAYYDNKVFTAAKLFGSSVTSLVQPISIMFVFVVWFLIEPQSFYNLIQNPLNFLTVFLALSLISVCIFNIKKNKASKEALVYLMPCILCVIAMDIIMKKMMILGAKDLASAIYFYTLFTSFYIGLFSLLVYTKQKKDLKILLNIKNLYTFGLPIMLLIIIQGALKAYSFHLVPNPAYVTAILYSTPIWVLLINKYALKRDLSQDKATPSKKTIFALVLGVIILILASN